MDLKKEISLKNLKKFAKNTLIICRSAKQSSETIYTYANVAAAAERVQNLLKKYGAVEHHRISTQFDHSPALITVILSILDLSCSFCPIHIAKNSGEVQLCMERYKSKYLLTETCLEAAKDFQILEKVEIFHHEVILFKCESVCNYWMPNMCYSIQTSGTTGQPKIVNCSYECISPNIVELSKIFSVNEKDVIFISSPPTFDPFVVDVFLALLNGACVLIVPKEEKLSVTFLQEILFPKAGSGVTIMQMTPSNFCRLIDVERAFEPTNSLRIIVLGGEAFPNVKVFQKWQDWESDKRKKVFNIYGITEVSCWSTIEEVTGKTTDVSLGNAIDKSIILQVKCEKNEVLDEGEGELFIGSEERICVIDDEDPAILNGGECVFRQTGDIVKITNTGKLYYKGRTNEVVKRYGHRVSLSKISNVLKTHEKVVDTCSVFDQESYTLICFVIARSTVSETELDDFLKCKVEAHELPDELIFIEEFPLSCHGKISKIKLLDLYKNIVEKRKSKNDPLSIFKARLKEQIQDLGDEQIQKENLNKKLKTLWDTSFLSAGGTSFAALQIVNEIEIHSGIKFPDVLTMLMDDKTSLNTIVFKIKEKTVFHDPKRTILDIPETSELLRLKMKWKYDLKKCVDASPTIIKVDKKTIISVGSHSHMLVNICGDTGLPVSTLALPDRVEGQVSHLVGPFAVVGCYDGVLYKFNVFNGTLMWKFDSSGMIKCKPYIYAGIIIFGNYSKTENLFGVDANNGEVKWSCKLSEKGILSSPTKWTENSVVICTLDGLCCKVSIFTGTIEVKILLKSPIFSTATRITDENILVAEVSGLLHIFDKDGHEMCSLKLDGNIFSSFEISESNEIFCGCYDRRVYCLTYENSKNIEIKWSSKLESQIYATPKLISSKQCLIACSTNGTVHILHTLSGRILSTTKLDGEIFSTPAVEDRSLYVGCRDNYLYCFDLD